MTNLVKSSSPSESVGLQPNIANFTKGWFIGNFEPTLLATNDFEIAVKEYDKGAIEEAHVHKVATEYTVVLHGKIIMLGQEFGHGDIVVVNPGIATAFEALTDVTTIAIKVPCVQGDKYPTHV